MSGILQNVATAAGISWASFEEEGDLDWPSGHAGSVSPAAAEADDGDRHVIF